jgi:hypothetical protein
LTGSAAECTVNHPVGYVEEKVMKRLALGVEKVMKMRSRRP